MTKKGPSKLFHFLMGSLILTEAVAATVAARLWTVRGSYQLLINGPLSLRVVALVFYRALGWPAICGLSRRFKPNSIWSRSLASIW